MQVSARFAKAIVLKLLLVSGLLLTAGSPRAELWSEGHDLGYGHTSGWYGRWWIDINGDGRSDYCRLVGQDGRSVSCTLASFDALGAPAWGNTVHFDGVAQQVGISVQGTRRWADIDGDGIPEYCFGHGVSVVACHRLVVASGAFTGVAGIDLGGVSYGDEGAFHSFRGDSTFMDFADVNGDGRSDLCVIPQMEPYGPYELRCYLSTGTGFESTPWTFPNIDPGHLDRGRGWVDYNGDGFADLCRLVGPEWQPFIRCTLSSATGFIGEITSQQLPTGGFREGSAFIDFNGDGKTDYCFVAGTNNHSNSVVACYLSTGAPMGAAWANHHFPATHQIISPMLDWGHAHARWWIDINGDGMADYCRTVGTDPNHGLSQLSCRLSRGDSFGFSDVLSQSIGFGEIGGRGFCDANGDGIAELCRVAGSVIHAGLRDPVNMNIAVHAQPQLLTHLTDGLGTTTHVTYLPFTNPRIYTRDAASRWPDQLVVQPATFAVYDTDARRSDGVRLTGRSLYHYRNMRTDTQGHGSRGTEERRMLNQGNNTLERVFYYQGLERGVANTPDLRRQVLLDIGPTRAKETYVMSGASSLSQWEQWLRAPATVATGTTEPTFPGGLLTHWVAIALPQDASPANPGHRFSAGSTERSWDLNGSTRVALPTVTVTSAQDQFGNVTNLTRTTQHDGLTWRQITTNTFDNGSANLNNWLMGRLTRARVESQAPSVADQFARLPGSAGTSQFAADTSVPLPGIGGMGVVSASRPNPGSLSVNSSLTVTGGLPPYAFAWTRVTGSRIAFSPNNALTTTFSASLPNWGENVTERFQLAVTDATGRSVTRAVDVTMTTPAQLAVTGPASVLGSRPSPGTGTASATPTATGGLPPYTFAWSRLTGSRVSVAGTNPATFSVVLNWSENLTETYRVTATDSAGNAASRDVNVTFTTPAQLLVTGPGAITGRRGDPGTLSVTSSPTAAGGTPPYAFAWARIAGSRIGVTGSNPATLTASMNWAENFTETFRITATDAAGVTAARDVNANFSTPAQLISSISPTIVRASRTGAGPLSATASVAASGGTPGYSFNWARETGSLIAVSGAQTATFSATLAEGQSVTERFRVTVTDAAGVQTASFVDVTMAAPAPLAVLANPSAVSGMRFGAGGISCSTTLGATGGVAPHTFSVARLTGSQVSANVSGTTLRFSASLSIGVTETFRITAVDAVGTTATRDISASFEVDYEPGLSGTRCFGSANPLSVTLNPPSVLSIAAGGPGTATGSATASATGGAPPYSFSWTRLTGSRIAVSGGQTATFSASVNWGESFTESFRVTVTDALGGQNIRDLNVTVSTPGALIASSSPANPSGSRAGPGTVSTSSTLSASGGTPPYTYSWSRLSGAVIGVAGGQTGTFSANLSPGQSFTENFRGTVSDAAARSTFSDVSVSLSATAAPPLSVSVSPSPLSGSGAGTFSLTATVGVSGGLAPYGFAWTQLSSYGYGVSVSGGQTAVFTGVAYRGTWCEPGEGSSAVFRVTVTDSAGQVQTADLATYFNPLPPSGPPLADCW